MKTGSIVGFALAVALAASCAKGKEMEPSVVDNKTYEFGQIVRNLDYTEEVVLEGVGETSLETAENLPSWIGSVTLRESGFQGNPVALVAVKGDDRLEEEREATVVLKMGSGATVNLTLNQWPLLREKANDIYKSVNTAFEANWAAAKKIIIVISQVTTNGKKETKTQEVSLPWDFEHLPACYLPKGDGRDATKEVNKMIEGKGDWSLVFNLTGIYNCPNYHYFGLYNRYTGVLRVFYYFTEDLIPDNSTNDHLWAFSLNADLAEHISTQFAIPKDERATLEIRKEAAKPVLVTPTTDSYNPLLSSGKTVPAVGWWAFDVNMSALRDHDFFQETIKSSAIDINLCTYAKENVLLNSVLQGSINGHLQGKMNLDLIAPTSTSGWAKIVSPLLSTGSQIALNTYVIKEGFIKSTGNVVAGNENPNLIVNNQIDNLPGDGGGPLPAVARPRSVAVGAIVSVAIGAVMSLAAKYIDSFAKQKVVDEDFGALNATMNLDLNAVMTTAGTIGGPTANKVPPASMTMDYLKKTNPDGTPTCLGDGIWNLNNHPVIYVVKDAFWSENNFNSFGAQKEFPLGGTDVYSYDLAGTKGSRPGLRLITFLDPTSVGGLSFNGKLFDNGIELLKVYLSYGVYPGSEPGYSDAFRKAAGLDYTHTWRLSAKDSFDSSKDLKLFKQPHTSDLFKWTRMDDEIKDVAAYRLSSQKLRTDHPGLERRFYGASLYYSLPYATDFTVDEVQYVYDPQIFLPFDDVAHRIYDPIVPDLVVSAALFGYGKDSKDGEEATLTNTLRFLPRIELISYKDVESVYNQILARKAQIKAPDKTTTVFVDMGTQIEHINDIVKALQ